MLGRIARMDIVYVFKGDPENDSEELRYSLRSLKNIEHDKVFLVGEKPNWVKNIIHIDVPQDRSKNENVKRNLRTAVNDDRISEQFLLMNDDFFIMKKVKADNVYNMGYMRKVIKNYDKRYPEGTDYIDNMKRLYDRLISMGFKKPVSYELHVPIVINKNLAKRLFASVGDGRLYQFRSFYGNFSGIKGKRIKDVKVFKEIRHNDRSYNRNPVKYLSKQTFISATGGAFKTGLVGEFLRNSFKEKSEYEA